MLLADSALCHVGTYTCRESTTQQIHNLAMWLSLEQILPFLQVQFPYYYHNCNSLNYTVMSFDCLFNMYIIIHLKKVINSVYCL